jgi:hypothetical protein
MGDRPAWRPPFVLSAVLAVAAWLAGLVFLGVPTRLIIVLSFGTAILNLVVVPLSRRLRRRRQLGVLTGSTLAPPAVSPTATPTPAVLSTGSSPTRWVGGANLQTAHRRLNATMPLAVLTLAPGSLRLSLRPKLFNQLWRIGPLVLSPTDDVEVFPVKTRGWTRGVGIRVHDAEVSYFWTDEREAVLQALASAGFRVSWDERRYAR